jgi:hypothetical protein
MRRNFFSLGLIFFMTAACTKRGDYVFQEQFLLQGIKSQNIISEDSTSAVLRSGQERIKLRSLPLASTPATNNLISLTVQGLFHPSVVPYPGTISHDLHCPQKYAAREIETRGGDCAFRGFQFYANARFTPGACTAEEAKYLYYRGTVKCAARNVALDLEYFSPAESTGQPLEGFLKRIRRP